ncbi:MAG: tRNA (adenosine(37)-N6)-threonylcarbamoyltransferase complex ATPase subunit type 1 TsaE [Candidatus Omnitrophica bacterium]|nr:tRNA (adenosine(37)-N6)-threonylcarbamoyltransferase complex ATPase subunit type 1 TsaE [Candidatus Omnitrophota bacterium]MBU4589636.1 tRNA (adenosine(37)-N6)-threonylcarbamoyltransferase complex ATPase subunit type 1 TsaE [Candidatus Omnitrophota bacterium]
MLTRSAKETIRLGKEFAGRLRKGDVVALCGDLGSGKTTFTKGIGNGLGVKDALHINSPTFVLIKEYEGRLPLYHLDLYRLNDLKDIEDIAVEEYMYGDGVTIIEWAEKAKKILPKKHIVVKFKVKGAEEREIRIEDLRD